MLASGSTPYLPVGPEPVLIEFGEGDAQGL